MSDNVINLKGVDRPQEIALMTAIEDAIDDVAIGKMTHIEVVGVLEMIKAKYTSHMVEIDID